MALLIHFGSTMNLFVRVKISLPWLHFFVFFGVAYSFIWLGSPVS